MSKLDTIIQKTIQKVPKFGVKKRSRIDTDIHRVVDFCRDEVQKAVDTGIMPSPQYFEQAAVISRKDKQFENEVAICNMYINLAKQFAIRNKLSRSEFYEFILPKCAPLYKRMHYAKDRLFKNAA